MAFADVNGQRVVFTDSGGDGSPIVFSHGFPTHPMPVNAAIIGFLDGLEG